MRVRDAGENDLEAILDIYNHAVVHSTCTADVEPQTIVERRAWWRARIDDGLPVVVADDGERVVGWGSLSRYHARFGYRFTIENSVYVHPERRGKRIGALILDELIARARSLGFHVMVAGLDGENLASRRLHERAGFVEKGRLVEIITKFDRWLDVVYMQLTL